MELFTNIFYTIAGAYLVFCIFVAISSRLAKFILISISLTLVLALASIAIMGGWALITFLSSVIM